TPSVTEWGRIASFPGGQAMSNVSITHISTNDGMTTLRGTRASGVEVEVKNGTNTLGSDTADNSETWSISFPSVNNNAVVVKGGGKNIPISTLTVDTATGVVTIQQTLVVHHSG